MNYRIILSCLFVCLCGITSYGQDNPRLSLGEMWEKAYAIYPSMEAYRSQLQQATYQRELVRHEYLPQVQLQLQNTLGTTQSVGGAFFPLPGIYNIGGTDKGISTNPSASLFGSVIVDWQIMQFGKKSKSMQAGSLGVSQATSMLETEKVAIQTALSRNYFQVLYHRKMVDWAEGNRSRFKSLLDAATSLARAGISPGADSLLIKASLKQASAQLEDWKSQREESEVLLGVWLDLPPEQIDPGQVPFLTTGESLILETSDKNVIHPLVTYRKDQVEQARVHKELVSINALPSLSLLGGGQFRTHSPALGEGIPDTWKNSYQSPVSNYLVGVGLKWNLNNLFDYKLNKGQYQEKILQRQAEADETLLNLSSQQQIAQRQLTLGKQQISHAEEAAEAASEAFRLFQARYNSGLISITELLQIQDLLQRTERTRIDAYNQYWMQQVDLASSQADFSFLQQVFK